MRCCQRRRQLVLLLRKNRMEEEDDSIAPIKVLISLPHSLNILAALLGHGKCNMSQRKPFALLKCPVGTTSSKRSRKYHTRAAVLISCTSYQHMLILSPPQPSP